ncbi:MAG: UbiD family decarboxylase [Deltaproteobacteria bacterium]|nr:UbiD family decarboxylase [Deltaproteobacteria bacterium]
MPYADLQKHLTNLEEKNLLVRIRRPINKDTELHPLFRWQFRGGLPESARKAFYFENVVDSGGRHYTIPVVIGALGASPAIYEIAMGCPIDEIPQRWQHALHHPIEPVIVDDGPVHEIVLTGAALDEERGGLLQLPIPISTPGFDNAPYTTCSHFFTKDPETGIRNQGNYRGQLKGQRVIGLQAPAWQDVAKHWEKCRIQGKPLPAALVIGAPPIVSHCTVLKAPFGVDELGIASALAGEPIRLVRCKTVELEVPMDAEIVVEGFVRTDFLEPEGPFGESHGYIHPRTLSPVMEVTAITMKRRPVYATFMSQMTPNESSSSRRTGFEAYYLNHLRQDLGIKSVVKVSMHEKLTNLRKLIIVQMKKPAESEVWRALHGVANFQPGVGKFIIAVDEDIDPRNMDAVWWAMCYRSKPHKDVLILPGRVKGHSPPFKHEDRLAAEDSAMLINAILKEPFPPISLPKREYMERAKQIWEELEFPALNPEPPWFGYSLGDWDEEWEEEAEMAVTNRYLETGEKLAKRRVKT